MHRHRVKIFSVFRAECHTSSLSNVTHTFCCFDKSNIVSRHESCKMKNESAFPSPGVRKYLQYVQGQVPEISFFHSKQSLSKVVQKKNAHPPLLCNISRSFLMDSSRAPRVCFCVSILSSISSNVFRRRKSSLACLSCSQCSRLKFSSVSSDARARSRLWLAGSCWNSWLRSRWILSSSWSACTVIWRC